MAITSENKHRRIRFFTSSQFRYSLIYILITLVVLLFLNVYSSGTSQKLFYQNKEASMLQKCKGVSTEIAKLEILNRSTVAAAMKEMGSLQVSRLIITDHNGKSLYDTQGTDSSVDDYVLFPEVVAAMESNDVFSWRFDGGVMHSHAAMPIVSYGTRVGCVYIMEYDPEQGALIRSLQSNILSISLILVLVVIVFSICFSTAFTRRLRQIMASMRIIREGDYTHKLTMKGRDELAFLGSEVNELTDRLEESEEKRRQFVSDASHELKTPLASIKLLSDSILQNDMDTETVREFVGDIGNEADRLNRMSQKLLSLSRVESQLDGDCEIVSMTPTIERVVRMLSGIADKNGVTIESDLDADCPILILEDDLYQIIFNLVENGIKYNLPGGKLFLRLRREGENAVFTATDTGVGIPEDAIGHIFERFYRVDKARSRKTGGSGLGLSIVRNMVERNQGTIGIESTMGQGSVFTVTFPIFDTEEESQ